MNPWTVIGWLFLGGLALLALTALVLVWDAWLYPKITGWVMYRRTHRIAPKPGQVWVQGKSFLTITRIHPNGRIGMTTKALPNSNGASWADTPEEWQSRLKNRRIWLLKERCEFWGPHLDRGAP